METPEQPSNITVLLRSRESAERTIREILTKQIEREKLIAARDAELQRVGKKHSPAIDDLTETIDRDFELLESWADENRAEFGQAKSIAIADCRIGWRTGQPKVETRGKLTFKTIVAQLVKLGGDLKEKYIRTKEELNKEAVLDLNRIAEGREQSIAALPEKERKSIQAEAADTLKKLGLRVTQTENFYLEPDREGQPEIRLTGEAKEAA